MTECDQGLGSLVAVASKTRKLIEHIDGRGGGTHGL